MVEISKNGIFLNCKQSTCVILRIDQSPNASSFCQNPSDVFHLDDILESIPEAHYGLLPLSSFDGIDLTRNLVSSISLNIFINQDMKSFHPHRAREKRLKPVN